MRDAYELMDAALANGIDLDTAQLGQLPSAEPGDEPYWPEVPSTPWVQSQPEIKPGQTAPGTTPPGFGWPAAVPIRPANWNLDTQPDSYKIAWGDTLAGLSATYLGTPMRWREIWNEQPDTYRATHSPDVLMPGQWIFMPPDATATLLAALGEEPPPGTTPAPPPPGGYPTPVGPPATGPGAPTAKKKTVWPWVVGGGALAALAAYAMS